MAGDVVQRRRLGGPGGSAMKPLPSGNSYSIRLTGDLVLIARELGSGSIAEGIRRALRSCSRRDAQPVPLSTLLRSAAFMAAELEEGVSPAFGTVSGRPQRKRPPRPPCG